MINVILENEATEEICRVFEVSNSAYLIQEDQSYKCLSLLSDCSYDIFASTDMENLIQDLNRLKEKLVKVEQLEHVENIIALARECQATESMTLIFTPWQTKSKWHSNDSAISITV